ncbi:MAG: hypothetical protein JWR50_572 [Mucilaginibacter sp.]|nr:hypothetical protein [Mucilaginibacter sp.]
MPVRYRKYENLLQFILGGIIWLAIIYAIIEVILRLFNL